MSVFAKTKIDEGLEPTALDKLFRVWRDGNADRPELFTDSECGRWLRSLGNRLLEDASLAPQIVVLESLLKAPPSTGAVAAFKAALETAVEHAYPWASAVRRHRRYAAGVTSDHNLDSVDLGMLRQIEDDATTHSDVRALVSEALRHLRGTTLLTSIQAAAMYDVYGEALVQRVLRQRFGSALAIRKVSAKTSAPDFECVLAPDVTRGRETELRFYVEVKTFDVAGGAASHDIARDVALDSELSLERQVRSGKRVAIETREMAPWRKPDDRNYRTGSLRLLIDRCVERAANAFKSSQFKLGPTFACVVLVRTQTFDQGDLAVLPIGYESESGVCVSGFVYNVAFGRPGWQVHQAPEFEGAQTLDGVLARDGLLADTTLGLNAAGLLMLDHQRGYRLDGVFDSSWMDDDTGWSNLHAEDVLSIACDAWNDFVNSNYGSCASP